IYLADGVPASGRRTMDGRLTNASILRLWSSLRPSSPPGDPDLMDGRHHLVAERVEGVGLAHVAQADDALVDAHLGKVAELVDGLLRRYTLFTAAASHHDMAEGGFLNFLVRTAFLFAVAAQHVQLVLHHLVPHAYEEVASVAVLGYEAQCLLFASTTNH